MKHFADEDKFLILKAKEIWNSKISRKKFGWEKMKFLSVIMTLIVCDNKILRILTFESR